MTETFVSGGEALAAGFWQEAHALFNATLAVQESAAALDGLAMAAWWLDDVATVLGARERAYRLYRRSGEALAAGRVALHLGIDHWTLRDSCAVANGWLQRAEFLLAGLDVSAEHGWMALWQGQVALLLRHDPRSACQHSARAADIARELGLREIEILGQAQEGLALASDGDVGPPRRLDDWAEAVDGPPPELDLLVASSFQLLHSWEQLRDFDAIVQWGTALDGLPEPWVSSAMVWRCRMARAGALVWRGGWTEAEATLEEAVGACRASGSDVTVEARVRLAKLRRRQGRYEEAISLLEAAESAPLLVRTESEILLGWAELVLDDGDAAAARTFVERAVSDLTGVPSIRWLSGLELLVHVEVAFGKRDLAHEALVGLQRSTCTVTTDGVRASIRLAEGIVASSGEALPAACDRLEEAVVLFERAGAPFEAAQARIELAGALSALGRRSEAEREATAAMDALCGLGAVRLAERARARLPRLGDPPEPDRRQEGRLTTREGEVLRLVAEGHSNHAIAAELIVSVRTVERHLSNIYEKIGASGKAARTAAVAHARRHRLLPEPHDEEPPSRNPTW